MDFEPTILVTSLMASLFVFLSIFVAFSNPKASRMLKEEESDDWVYANLLEKMYYAICGKTDPIKLSKSLGLEYDKYMINCNIIGKVPNFKKECMMRIIGLFSFVLGLILAAIFFNLIPMFLGIALFVLLVTRTTKQVETAAENKKSRLITDLPRFVDLFLSALEIDLPVETAIMETVENVPCIVSEELKVSLTEMKMGAKSWQKALEDIAHKYEVDLFSDFVLDIITSYNKGVSIVESVSRQSFEIRQSALLVAKERTAKMSTTILVPIVVFKLIPLLAIMMIPIVIQVMTSFS